MESSVTVPRLPWDQGPVFAIAEIGLNHGGSFARACEMVDAAARAGASAIKLQSIVADQLVSDDARLGHVGTASLRSFFRTLELDWEAHRALVERAHQQGLVAMTTPFAVSDVPRLAEMGFDAFKVASGDLTYGALVCAVASTGRPMVLSSGMSTIADVARAMALATRAGASQLAVLHCVSAYPTPVADENLRAIVTLRQACGVPVGLSDHGRGLASAIAAVALGATLYERHLVLPGDAHAVDQAVSSTPGELAAIVAAMEDTRVALGDGVKVCRPAERRNVAASRRGLYSTRALPAGHRILGSDVIALRPSTELVPADEALVVGATLRRAMRAGEAFHPADMTGETP
jgi:N,N'-diacetyllegionaminate synthase